ncbi:Chalcone--flavonone isomerase [Apostasia shenzhenica]|uniref:Chalcone-flavonone isomerase family protein n=1 Tax=Apostasia shenzhenica TaxID=1088818 RepID=A0A2H9ZSK3_9ASPA|nr:Chalcone--flavonone isomerase [Apostasia shenzhenica]
MEVAGIEFPEAVTAPGSSKNLFLGGAGVRGLEIGGNFIVVTAIGVYLEAGAALKVLAEKWKGKSPEELAGSVGFFRDIATGPFEKLTRVTMVLPLTGQQYSEKVAENCAAAWKAAGVYTDEEESAINDFLQAFKPRSFPPGASIFFTHSPSGSLSIGFSKEGGVPAAEAAAAAVIKNEKLKDAVLESIIGENGVSPAVKRSLAQRIFELLR